MMKRLVLAGLAAALLAATTAQAEPIGERRFVMALRMDDTGSVGFVDLASVRTIGDHKEADTLLVLRAPTQASEPSHIIARVSIDCPGNRAQALSMSAYDSDDRLLDTMADLRQDLGPMDAVTRALACGGDAAPANPRVFPTAASAAAWARTGGV
jgi:hypothetical protein